MRIENLKKESEELAPKLVMHQKISFKYDPKTIKDRAPTIKYGILPLEKQPGSFNK